MNEYIEIYITIGLAVTIISLGISAVVSYREYGFVDMRGISIFSLPFLLCVDVLLWPVVLVLSIYSLITNND